MLRRVAFRHANERNKPHNMQSRLRWCLLAVTPLALLLLAQAQEKQPPFSIAISASQAVKAGSTVWLGIAVKNISGSRIDMEMASGVNFNFLFSVRDLEGKKAPETPLYEAIQGEEPHTSPHISVFPRWSHLPTWLSPDETLYFNTDVGRLFELKPGKYTIQLGRPQGPGAAVGVQRPNQSEPVITSNTINLTVTP